MDEKIEDLEEFGEFLSRKKIAESTLYQYLRCHIEVTNQLNKFGLIFDQDFVDAYLTAKNTSITRAYIKNYLEFKRDRDIIVPKITGRKPRRKPQVLSEKEVAILYDFLYRWRKKYGLMFILDYIGGLRKGELLGITEDDFDWGFWLDNRDKKCPLKIRGKGGRERYIPVPSWLMKEILEFYQESPPKEDETLFRLKRSRWADVFAHACLRCFGKKYKPHEIRHSSATNWYQEGKDIFQIKNRLGHSNISTTQLYINPSEEEEFTKWMEED